MTVEIIVAGSSMVIAVVAVSGVLVTWRKNGKRETERDTTISLNQDGIIRRLDDEDNGLGALNRKVNSMTTHCATVSTGLTERMIAAERDIKEVKANRRSSKAP